MQRSSKHSLIEALGSETRIRILGLLSLRPRSIAELADELRISLQAVNKHLTILEELEMVEGVEIKEDVPVKKLYRIKTPIYIHTSFDKVFSLHTLVLAKHDKREGEEDNICLDDLEDERLFLIRRIRSLEARILRLFERLCEVEYHWNLALKRNKISIIDEAILRACFEEGEECIEDVGLRLRVGRKKAMESYKKIAKLLKA
jgi:predicted transcriptional regulator